jgi:hypothetical protein
MDNKNKVPGKLKRRKFFASAGKGLLGITLLSQFPFNLFGRTTGNNAANNTGVKVEINPFAVNRKKTGGKNA